MMRLHAHTQKKLGPIEPYRGLFFIRETQISEAERTEICKSNNPDEVGGYNTPQLCCGICFQSLLWGFIPVIGKEFEVC